MTLSSSGMSSGLVSVENSMPQNLNLQMSMSNSALTEQGMNMELHMNQQSGQTTVTQSLHQSAGLQPGVLNSSGLRGGLQSGIPGMQTGLQMPGMPAGIQAPNLPSGMSNSGYPMQTPRMPTGSLQNMPSGLQGPRVQTPGMQPVLQNVGITNSALNASLGLPIGPTMGMPMQGMPQQILPNDIMANNASMGATGMGVMGSGSIQGSGNLPRFPTGNAMPGMPSNVGNASLLFGQNSSSPVVSEKSLHVIIFLIFV